MTVPLGIVVVALLIPISVLWTAGWIWLVRLARRQLERLIRQRFNVPEEDKEEPCCRS